MSFPLLLILVQVFMSLRKASYGLMAYYVIRLCVPTSLRLYGYSFNTCCFALLAILTIAPTIRNYFKSSADEKSMFKAYGVLLVVSFLLCFIPNFVPLQYQISNLVQFFLTEILPACYILLLIRREEDFMKISKVLLAAGLFSVCYGIYTFATDSNPLYEMLATEKGEIKDFSESGRLGVMGRAVGIYHDKIFMSLICLLFIIYYAGKNFVSQKVVNIFLLLASTCMVLTLQRSAIFALAIFVIVFYVDKKYYRYIAVASVLLVVALTVINLYSSRLGGLSDFIMSSLFLWDEDLQASVGGSSTAMRIAQFNNVLDILRGHTLYGLGYSFSSYYYTEIWDAELYGLDHRFYGFESFLLKILVASGIIGILVWGWAFYRMFQIMQGNIPIRKFKYFLAFMMTYILAILMTDTSGSMFLFFSFVSLNIIYRKYHVDVSQNRPLIGS